MDWYEIEVRAKNAKGEADVVYGEYQTSMSDPHDAAREIIDHVIKNVGNERMREIDVTR